MAVVGSAQMKKRNSADGASARAALTVSCVRRHRQLASMGNRWRMRDVLIRVEALDVANRASSNGADRRVPLTDIRAISLGANPLRITEMPSAAYTDGVPLEREKSGRALGSFERPWVYVTDANGLSSHATLTVSQLSLATGRRSQPLHERPHERLRQRNHLAGSSGLVDVEGQRLGLSGQ